MLFNGRGGTDSSCAELTCLLRRSAVGESGSEGRGGPTGDTLGILLPLVKQDFAYEAQVLVRRGHMTCGWMSA